MACIIRHNKNLKEYHFYHITFEEKNNTAVFNKSGEIVEGINNIIEEIKKINEQAVNEKNFSNSFYLLEINISFNDLLNNSKFFEKYDLLDIPGLDYFQEDELKTIFSPLIGKIKFCIYLFDSMYFRDKIGKIKNFREEIGLKFIDSLFILNKMDKIEEKEKIESEFKYLLFENINNIFDNSNTIIALDSIFLKYENLCKKVLNLL